MVRSSRKTLSPMRTVRHPVPSVRRSNPIPPCGPQQMRMRKPNVASGSACTAVALKQDKGETQTTEIDDVGNFTFDEISPGTYHLEVTLGDDNITIEGLPIGQ